MNLLVDLFRKRILLREVLFLGKDASMRTTIENERLQRAYQRDLANMSENLPKRNEVLRDLRWSIQECLSRKAV